MCSSPTRTLSVLTIVAIGVVVTGCSKSEREKSAPTAAAPIASGPAQTGEEAYVVYGPDKSPTVCVDVSEPDASANASLSDAFTRLPEGTKCSSLDKHALATCTAPGAVMHMYDPKLASDESTSRGCVEGGGSWKLSAPTP